MGKAFEKQITAIENQRKKQVEALKYLKPKKQTKALRVTLITKIINQKPQIYLTILLKKEKV